MCCEGLRVESLTDNKYKFLCSVYHVIKYLVNQHNIEMALKLSSFVFLTSCEVDEEDISSVYYNYYYLFFHEVATKKKEYLEGKTDLSTTLVLLKHSVKFLKCCIGTYLLHALDSATRFVRDMKLSDEHHLQIVKIQVDILELTYCKESERCKKIDNENIYKSYLSLLSSILKSLCDTKQLKKAQDVIRKTVECIGTWNRKDVISNDCSIFLQDVLYVLFERPDDFANRMEASTRVLKSLVIKYRDSKILSWTCISLALVLHNVSSYWITQHVDEWNQHMSFDAQKDFFHFISCLSELLLASKCVKCILPSGEECSVNNDTVSSVNLLSVIIDCVMSSVANKSKGFARLLPDAKAALSEAITRIEILKQANCPVWKGNWKRYAIKTYNLGVRCNSAELIHEAKEFLSKFCWTCIQLGEQPASPEAENGMLGWGMQWLIQVYKDLKKYREALSIAAVALVILPKLKEKFVQQWAKIKNYALTENCKNVQTLTIYDILTEDKKIGIHIDIEAVNIPQLLIWELEAYSLSSFLSWQCVQAVYDKFCSLSPNCYMKVHGLLAYLPSLWINGSIEQCADAVSSVKSTLEALKEETQSIGMDKGQLLCLLGNLYYWLFLCQLKVTRSKQEEEILCSNIIPTKMQSQQEDNHDPLETCDVTPAYRNLNLQNESETLETLNEAVACWSDSLEKGFNGATEVLNPLPNIEVAACSYELYGYITWKLRSWCLYVKFAETLDSKEAVLLGLCHLLEWCTCGMTECKLLARAQDITEVLKLEDEKGFDSQLLFHKYLLARGRHCLRNEKFTEIGDCVEKLVVFTKREKVQHFAQSILHVQTGLLISQCKCLPRPHIITWPSKNEKDVLSEASRTYSSAMSLLKQVRMTPAENTQALCLMLEVSQWLGQLSLDLFWPREAHCFMKGDLILAQKLGLTTRTAQFLNLLAQVDVMCCNVNDCQVKLQGMEGLLQLESRFQPYDIACKNRKIDAELSSQLKQLTVERSMRMAEFRDIPRVPLRNRSPHGSPNLRKIAFILPSFISHQADCQCHMCNTLTLQVLVLFVVYIQAQIYNMQSELKEALEFFEGGLQLFQHLVHKQLILVRKLGSEMHQLVPGQEDCMDSSPLLLQPLKLGYIQVERGYADFMASSSSYAQALTLNAEALLEVEKVKLAHVHLAADVMDQTFCIQQAHACKSVPKKSREEYTQQIEETPNEVADATIRTPLNIHRVLLPLSTSNIKNCDDSPIKIKPRKLVLPEAENDDSGKENKQTVNGKAIQKTRKIHVHKQKESKTMIVYEDSPTVLQEEKLPISRVKQRSVRTERNKRTQSQKASRSKRTPSEAHASLSKVCQALEFRIDSPNGCSKILQSSVNCRKQKSYSVSNIKALSPNVVDDKGAILTHVGLQGLNISIDDVNDKVFETTDMLPASNQAEILNREPSTSGILHDMHALKLAVDRPLRTYSKQNSKAQLKGKSATSQETVNTAKLDETIVPSSSPDEHIHIPVYARQTRGQLKKRMAKLILSSSVSEDETPPNLKVDGSHEEEAAMLPRRNLNKIVSASKRKLPLKHSFILN